MASNHGVHGPTIDPEALNASERRILALLAEGHTVKSIASTTGWSVAAINERLRVARRKTGVGSSRELARLLRAQENRDEEIGLAAEAGPQSDALMEAPAGRRGKWKAWIVMAAILLIGLAAGALALLDQSGPGSAELKAASGQARTDEVDPMVGDVLSSAPDLKGLRSGSKEKLDELLMEEGSQSAFRRLHAQVRAEARDDWSVRVEAMLRNTYLALPDVKTSGAQLRVICASTLCEIAIRSAQSPSQARLDRLYADLQSVELNQQNERAGVAHLTTLLGVVQDGRHLYLSYWTRKGAAGDSSEG